MGQQLSCKCALVEPQRCVKPRQHGRSLLRLRGGASSLRHARRSERRRWAVVGEPPHDRRAQGFGDRHSPIRLVSSLDDGPRRLGGAGHPDRLLRRVDEAVVHPPMFPLQLGDTPARQPIAFERLQPLALRSLVQMHPKLQDHSAVVSERLLEIRDAPQMVLELDARHAAVRPVDHRS
jgi:hypothetical protein